MKILFALIGLTMGAAGAWTFVGPLWQEGHRLLAAVSGLLVAVLCVALFYVLLG